MKLLEAMDIFEPCHTSPKKMNECPLKKRNHVQKEFSSSNHWLSSDSFLKKQRIVLGEVDHILHQLSNSCPMSAQYQGLWRKSFGDGLNHWGTQSVLQIISLCPSKISRKNCSTFNEQLHLFLEHWDHPKNAQPSIAHHSPSKIPTTKRVFRGNLLVFLSTQKPQHLQRIKLIFCRCAQKCVPHFVLQILRQFQKKKEGHLWTSPSKDLSF